MEIFVFAHFHVREGQDAAMAAAMQEVLAPTQKEPGCISARAFLSVTDSRFFYIHSRWVDQAAFDAHTALPHTLKFIEQIKSMVDRPPELTRTHVIV